jgi:hypothetical protein
MLAFFFARRIKGSWPDWVWFQRPLPLVCSGYWHAPLPNLCQALYLTGAIYNLYCRIYRVGEQFLGGELLGKASLTAMGSGALSFFSIAAQCVVAGSDRIPDLKTITSEPTVGKGNTIHESEMALFFECRQ